MESKIEKDFTLGDSSVNSYGFRLLTSGYMIDEFRKNPIGYFMHADGKFNRDEGVLVKWYDLRIEGDSIKAKPSINLSHTRGERTKREVESGFLNAASLGHLIIVESSDDEKLKLPGQTGPTITKWYNRECSLVDIPANNNAITLYDQAGAVLNLSDLLNKKSKVDYHQPIDEIQKVKNARIEFLRSKTFDELDNEGLLPELKLKDIKSFEAKWFEKFGKPYEIKKADTPEELVRKVIKDAFIENSITEEQLHSLKEKYANNPAGLITAVDQLKAKRLEYLRSLSFEELDENGLLEELMNKDKECYDLKLSVFKTDYKRSNQ